MEVVCIQDFGNCKVGDVRQLPDDADFSRIYFAPNPQTRAEVPAQLPESFAEALPEATGQDRETVPFVEPGTSDGEVTAAEASAEAKDQAPSGDSEPAMTADHYGESFGSAGDIVNIRKNEG